jgi:hypothetical protein
MDESLCPLLLCPESRVFQGRNWEIMGIEKDITEIINECEADDLARNLLERTRILSPPSREETETLARILDDVSREAPVYRALWIAFWLGCAWQDSRD